MAVVAVAAAVTCIVITVGVCAGVGAGALSLATGADTAFTAVDAGAVADVGADVAADESAAINGETAATRYGRDMHAAWDYGEGFEREFRLPSGRRVDGINLDTREVVELKPTNARAIRLGQRQLQGYLDELNQEYPGETPWTGSIQTYPPRN